MIKMKKKCPVCKKEFLFMDLRNVPATCGSKVCDSNWKYREKTKDPVTGKYQDIDEIGKW